MTRPQNQINLTGLTAVVTGGARGIGFAVASRLLKSGATVAIWDIDKDIAEASTEKLAPLGKAVAVGCNVADWESVSAALAETEKSVGTVDILVNSAGIAGANALVEDFDNAEFRRVMDINVLGTYHTNKAVVTGMKARDFGRIVNIASVAGKEGNPTASAYSASKAAVIAFTKSLGKETASHDIAVNCVTPAAARTQIFEQLEEEFIAFMLSKIPRGRFVEVDEIASMIAWMVSPENSFTTAAVFDLSGGRATY